MCGIACFLGDSSWREAPELSWMDPVLRGLKKAAQPESDVLAANEPLAGLAARFDELMSFGLCNEIAVKPEIKEKIVDIGRQLDVLAKRTETLFKRGETSPALESLFQSLQDYGWQIRMEVVEAGNNVLALIPSGPGEKPSRPVHYAAWSAEQVLQSIDKLEVRGRDSAGIAICFTLAPGVDPLESAGSDLREELAARREKPNADNGCVALAKLPDGGFNCRFLYKVANLVGQLGDNGTTLRRYIRQDKLFWRLARGAESVNIIAHTRWASNGIISVPNCHPVDGEVLTKEGEPASSREALLVLNGDVDNYADLRRDKVEAKGLDIHQTISTDAKILPVLFSQTADPDLSVEERFRRVMLQSQGSLAVIMQKIDEPGALYLAQKGSGQSFYLGRTANGWFAASEAYGLAALCRGSFPMAVTARGGVSVVLRADDPNKDKALPVGRFLEADESCELKYEAIEIFSRDIFREGYNFYIEKEIHEAPDSVQKTLHGKYLVNDGQAEFLLQGFGNGPALVERLKAKDKPPIRRIMAVGMGTASIAAMGAAYLIRRALGQTRVEVEHFKASELIGFVEDDSLEDMLVIAVSQSGTTTDTNRVVDICREKGAWVHSIVNRRNSPLVRKSNSHLYTSNGRDVEMAVASTKAFYSQIAAAHLLALLLAKEYGAMDGAQIWSELQELESLPEKIRIVLGQRQEIRNCAREYGPKNRNWAIVGNGPNRIAAEEIRIKLSELCYKSIPCDVTEDKKHIDLSTEPLTLVVANDLPEMVVSDTVKETTIFKAHNGQPIVFCAQGENRFDPVAEKTIKLPRIGAGLQFVLATVAGHLWGIDAAMAVDEQAEPFRKVRAMLAGFIEKPETWDASLFLGACAESLAHVEKGMANCALPAHAAAAVAGYALWLSSQPREIKGSEARLDQALLLFNRAVEEMTRPIDTIRHQAKTVTVGISRPQESSGN